MTLQAAELLDQAWATYAAIACAPDGSGISTQSPSWVEPSTPYDYAAAMVKSLFPFTYNYDRKMVGITNAIWDVTIDCFEILSFDNEAIQEILRDHATSGGHECDVCGYDERHIEHYKQCMGSYIPAPVKG